MVFKVNQNVFSLINYQRGMEMTSNQIAFCVRAQVIISRWNREDVSRGALKTVDVCRGESSNVSRVSSRLGLGFYPLLQSLIRASARARVCVCTSQREWKHPVGMLSRVKVRQEKAVTRITCRVTLCRYGGVVHIYTYSAVTFTVNIKQQKLWHEQ